MQLLDNTTQEEWFDIWAKPLIDAGYIDEIVTHPNVPTFKLFPGMSKIHEEVKIYKNKPNKIKEVSTTLIKAAVYTPDRIIKWNIKSLGIFFYPFDYRGSDWKECFFTPQKAPDGFYFSIIDIKGPVGSQAAYGGNFRFTQKWLWANTGQYVQKVMQYPALLRKDTSIYLWASTYTPNRFLYTDKIKLTKRNPFGLRKIPNKKGVPLWKVVSIEDFLNEKEGIRNGTPPKFNLKETKHF